MDDGAADDYVICIIIHSCEAGSIHCILTLALLMTSSLYFLSDINPVIPDLIWIDTNKNCAFIRFHSVTVTSQASDESVDKNNHDTYDISIVIQNQIACSSNNKQQALPHIIYPIWNNELDLWLPDRPCYLVLHDAVLNPFYSIIELPQNDALVGQSLSAAFYLNYLLLTNGKYISIYGLDRTPRGSLIQYARHLFGDIFPELEFHNTTEIHPIFSHLKARNDLEHIRLSVQSAPDCRLCMHVLNDVYFSSRSFHEYIDLTLSDPLVLIEK